MTNRLVGETTPHLQQHQDSPVTAQWIGIPRVTRPFHAPGLRTNPSSWALLFRLPLVSCDGA
jgi:hypothetical protein